MTVMTREPDAPGDFRLQDFLSFDTPEGYHAELIDGEIVVTPPPDGDHEDIIGLIVEQVFAKSRTRMNFAGTKGLIVPGSGTGGGGRVIPDATFAPAKLRLFRGAEPWMKTAGIELVLEVTSSRPDMDRDAKRRAYAGAGIPLYLLVDRQQERVTLFQHPAGKDYSSVIAESFGGGLDIPEPFSFTLETADFL